MGCFQSTKQKIEKAPPDYKQGASKFLGGTEKAKLGEAFVIEPLGTLQQKLTTAITSDYAREKWLPFLVQIGGQSKTPLGILNHLHLTGADAVAQLPRVIQLQHRKGGADFNATENIFVCFFPDETVGHNMWAALKDAGVVEA